MAEKIITINSRKFDGQIHRSWSASLIKREDSLLSFIGKFEKEVLHSKLGVIRRGTISYEYYWLDRWYNVFRFHEPEGRLRNYYCNINMPPIFENNSLDYVDLEIDVLVSKHFEVEILDLDEFEYHSEIYKYPSALKSKARDTLDEVLNLIKARDFPFI